MRTTILLAAGVFLLVTACGLVVIWADVSTWGTGRAGDIMIATFFIALVAAGVVVSGRSGT